MPPGILVALVHLGEFDHSNANIRRMYLGFPCSAMTMVWPHRWRWWPPPYQFWPMPPGNLVALVHLSDFDHNVLSIVMQTVRCSCDGSNGTVRPRPQLFWPMPPRILAALVHLSNFDYNVLSIVMQNGLVLMRRQQHFCGTLGHTGPHPRAQRSGHPRDRPRAHRRRLHPSRPRRRTAQGINLLCGVRISSTPYAIKQGGWLGLVILVVFALLAWYMQHLAPWVT